MEPKTKVSAEAGGQKLTVTREFDLPLELLFKAFADPSIVEQWMGTKVLQSGNKKSGVWQFQTLDTKGNILFSANSVIHEFIPDQKITRTFEMENVPFDAQLEFLEFERLDNNTSKLNMHILYKSTEFRDQMMQMGVGMAKGLDMIHNKLEKILNKPD